MRIQAGHHACNGVSDEFFIVNGFHIVTFDHAKNSR